MIENISTGMVREHWYKGRVVGSTRYVEGSLIVDANGRCYIGIFIQPEHKEEIVAGGRSVGKTTNRFNSIGFVEVHPSTVAEFTGIYDIHKKKIFEFDRIRHYNHTDDPAAYDEGVVFWDKKKLQWNRTCEKRRRGDPDEWCRIAPHEPCDYEVVDNENT